MHSGWKLDCFGITHVHEKEHLNNQEGGHRARGIDDATARQVLVYSFGLEVTQHFKHPLLQKRIQEKVNETLSQASLL